MPTAMDAPASPVGPLRFRAGILACTAAGVSLLSIVLVADSIQWGMVLAGDCVEWGGGDDQHGSRADAWLTFLRFDALLLVALALVAAAALRSSPGLSWTGAGAVLVLLPVWGPPFAAFAYVAVVPLLVVAAALRTLAGRGPA
jgi:hypothetical protein